jgi:hypothetical protein
MYLGNLVCFWKLNETVVIAIDVLCFTALYLLILIATETP